MERSTTADLDKAQKIIISQTRFTAEHNAPMVGLVEHFRLPKGAKQITVPKVGQFEAQDLVEGVDLTDEQSIGMTVKDLTTGEVGLRIILTDKLLRQFNEDAFRVVGRQSGDAMARKKDKDLLALLPALNGGTAEGGAGVAFNLKNLSALIAKAKGVPIPGPLAVVHHPHAIFSVVTSVSLTPLTGGPMPRGFSEDLLRDFYKFTINQVPVFEDGNIEADASGDGIGALLSKNAIAYVESVGYNEERERDASLRAWELVVTADYGCWEIDDTYGFPAKYDVSAPNTAQA